MIKAKRTISLMMIAIFTTFIVLSGMPTVAVTNTTAAKKAISSATYYVVKAEILVKPASFTVKTAQDALKAAQLKVKKVVSYGKAYTATVNSLNKRLSVVVSKINARIKATATKTPLPTIDLQAVVEAAVDKVEELTNKDKYDLVGSKTNLANAQAAAKIAQDAIAKISKTTAAYKGFVARMNVVNTRITKALADVAAIEKAKADAAAKAKEDEVLLEKANVAVSAYEATPIVTEADLTTAALLGTAANKAIALVSDGNKTKTLLDRMAIMDKKVAAVKISAKIVSIISADGIITVKFDKEPTNTAISNFKVTRVTNSVSSEVVTPTAISVNREVATISVPLVSPDVTDQSVYYSVAYGTDNTVNSSPYIVKALPALMATVSTVNLKEVVVTFNQMVDKITAEKTTNYTLSPNMVITDANLQEDGKTVILTVSTNLTQQAAYILTINGVNTVKKLTSELLTLPFNALDLAIPTAISATLIGPNLLRVTFSEPIKVDSAIFSLDNNTYSVGGCSVEASDTHSVDVIIPTNIPLGAHTMTVSGVSDFSGLLVNKVILPFIYAIDTTPPTVTVDSILQNSVTLHFSKAITTNASNLTVFHTYNNIDAYKGIIPTTWTDNKTVTVTFPNNYLPLGNATIFVNGGSGVNTLKDAWGNAFAQTSFNVTVAADLVAPTVTSTKIINPTTIDVTYSKIVNGANNVSNYVLKDTAGNTIAITNATVDGADGTLYHLTVPALNSGIYSLTISNIKDISIAQNPLLTYTTSLSLLDTSAPVVVSPVALASDYTRFTVRFSKPMATSGSYSILDVYKYQISLDGINIKELSSFTGVAISAGTDGKSAIISFPTPQNFSVNAYLNLGRVADSTGLVTSLYNIQLPIAISSITNANISNIKVVGKRQVQFTVDSNLSAINVNGFLVGGVIPGSTTYFNNGTTSIVTITTAADTYTADASIAPSITIAPNSMTNVIGNKNSALTLTIGPNYDYTAPSIISRTISDTNGNGKLDTVKIIFDEALYVASVSYDSFTVAGYTVTNLSVDPTNRIVILNLIEGSANDLTATPLVQLVRQVMDASSHHNILPAEITGVSATH